MIHGIGRVYAKKLVRVFGEKVFDVIEAESHRPQEVDGIGPVRADRIVAAWAEQKIVRKIFAHLHSAATTAFAHAGWCAPTRRGQLMMSYDRIGGGFAGRSAAMQIAGAGVRFAYSTPDCSAIVRRRIARFFSRMVPGRWT